MALQITIRFNHGYLCEVQGKFEQAEEIYKQIIQAEPSYADAYLRLSYMARDKNDAKQALSYVDEALKNHVKRAGFGLPTNLHCFKGMMLQHFGMNREAFAEF